MVTSRAESTGGLPDHQVAIILSSLVAMGAPVAPGLLQQLLLRAPRNNLSPGIVKDLMAALQQLEQVGCRFVCVRGGGGA